MKIQEYIVTRYIREALVFVQACSAVELHGELRVAKARLWKFKLTHYHEEPNVSLYDIKVI
jgi:hypothetical protein